MGKLGPHDNFTAYIYTYTYIHTYRHILQGLLRPCLLKMTWKPASLNPVWKQWAQNFQSACGSGLGDGNTQTMLWMDWPNVVSIEGGWGLPEQTDKNKLTKANLCNCGMTVLGKSGSPHFSGPSSCRVNFPTPFFTTCVDFAGIRRKFCCGSLCGFSVLRLKGRRGPRNPQKKFTQKSMTKSTLNALQEGSPEHFWIFPSKLCNFRCQKWQVQKRLLGSGFWASLPLPFHNVCPQLCCHLHLNDRNHWSWESL